nr:hypothetical protein B0A51_15610 [Rachicladosporium sp. CCFEE 5018]
MFVVSGGSPRASICSAKRSLQLKSYLHGGRSSTKSPGKSGRQRLPVFRAPKPVASAEKSAQWTPPPNYRLNTLRGAARICLPAVAAVVVYYIGSEARYLWLRHETVALTGRERYVEGLDVTQYDRASSLTESVSKPPAAVKDIAERIPSLNEVAEHIVRPGGLPLPPDLPQVAYAQSLLDKVAAVTGLKITLTVLNSIST